MPHARPRHLNSIVTKSLGFWPVVCLVGSRQVGKSTFLKGLSRYRYQTLDDPGLAALALRNPDEILDPPCVIDEAQKAPRVFDAVKMNVDREKRPGKFILTGSVRFSRRTLVRESLTGRAKTIQMFPLTCSEALALPFRDRWLRVGNESRVVRKDWQRYLAKGGMPAIFSARNDAETASYWNSLTESYVYRDLLLAVPKNPKPALAMAALRAIAEILALGEIPTFARILKKTGGTRAALERHIQGLEDMMILHRIAHWGASRTKDLFLPFDSAFFLNLLRLSSPAHDAAIHLACLYIALMNEARATAQSADRTADIQYAVSPKGEMIHLITRDRKNAPVFWKITEEPVPHAYGLRFLSAMGDKHKGVARVLTSSDRDFRLNSVQILPWERVL